MDLHLIVAATEATWELLVVMNHQITLSESWGLVDGYTLGKQV